ncbi:MAG: hypothetical protein R8G66_28960 [Cytophagales bacterium]|nr:hypothetical protein [Cytophagales bacterium]
MPPSIQKRFPGLDFREFSSHLRRTRKKPAEHHCDALFPHYRPANAPFIRPFKFGRILFTYLIPIVPLFVLWDGVVSSLRTYSIKEMNELVADLKGTETYTLNINKVKSGPGVILYMVGVRK